VSRTPIASLIGAALIAAAACASRPAESATARVDGIFAQWNRADSPGCGAGVGRDGDVLYENGYGMASLELAVRITPESVFPAASISKQFTAMSVLLLVQRGQVRLDEEVRKYAAARQDGSDPNDAILRVLVRQRGVNFPSGQEFQYNNGAYNLLGSIVKRVSGQSPRAFADVNIFQRLGISRTHFHDDPAMVVAGRVSNYWRDGRGWHAGSEVAGVIGNSGLYTTASDLLRWAHNFDEIRVGDAALIGEMQMPATLTSGEKSPYGFGVSIGDYRGMRTITHGGGDRGISTYFMRVPDAKLAVAVLCNSDDIPAQMLAERGRQRGDATSVPTSARGRLAKGSDSIHGTLSERRAGRHLLARHERRRAGDASAWEA
jgi:CubicO group peptidase (beta-lactamase class C family)